MSTLGASASPPPDLHMHQSLSPMPSPNLNSGTESEDLPEIAEAALAQKTVECDEYARRVEELEEEVLCLRRELATREMLGNVDTALHKDDVLQKLCDIVLLAEAMWKKIRKLQLHEVLRSKALERLYEAEGVVGIKENGVRGGRGNGAMNTGNGGDEDYDDGGEDPLKPLEEVNRELMELRSGVIECRRFYDAANRNASSLFSLLPFSYGISQMFLDFFRSEEAERAYRRKGTNMLQRLSNLVFESCEHLVAKQQEVNDYAEALLRPVVERDREFRKESLQEDSQGPEAEDDLLDFALGEDENEAHEFQLPAMIPVLQMPDVEEAEAVEYEL